MEPYPPRAAERTMQGPEAVLRALGGQIDRMRAGEIIGLSPRSMRRRRCQEYGYDGLFDRRRKRPSPNRGQVAPVEKAPRLIREKHRDSKLTHSVEKLHSEEGIELSYSWAISNLLPGDVYYQ